MMSQIYLNNTKLYFNLAKQTLKTKHKTCMNRKNEINCKLGARRAGSSDSLLSSLPHLTPWVPRRVTEASLTGYHRVWGPRKTRRQELMAMFCC